MRFLPPDPEKVRELEKVLDGKLVTPMMYPFILDIVDGRNELVPCPCKAKELIIPPPLVQVDVPLDYTDPAPAFGNFKVSKSNEEAFEVCRGWARAFILGKQFAAPLLLGPVGTGKTRLIWTMLREISYGIRDANMKLWYAETAKADAYEDVETRPAYRTFKHKYISVPRFSEEVRQRMGFHQDVVDYRSSLLDCDILVLDDLGAENATDLVREQLYLLVDDRLAKRQSMIVACNFNPGALGEWVGERLRSRLEGACDIVEISGTDMRASEKTRRLRESAKQGGP